MNNYIWGCKTFGVSVGNYEFSLIPWGDDSCDIIEICTNLILRYRYDDRDSWNGDQGLMENKWSTVGAPNVVHPSVDSPKCQG